MPSRHLPPSPVGMSLQQWALKVTNYLQAEKGDEASNMPKPVLLPQQMPTRLQSATIDGLVMFDPIKAAPVVSIDNTWREMLTGYNADQRYAKNMLAKVPPGTVATVTPPDYYKEEGGIIALFGYSSDYPQPSLAGLYYVDCGRSLHISPMVGTSTATLYDATTGPITIADAVDGRVLISAATGGLMIANKATQNYFRVTFL